MVAARDRVQPHPAHLSQHGETFSRVASTGRTGPSRRPAL